MRRRVVITGMGALSSAGPNLESHRENFVRGVCCLSPINEPRVAHLKARFAGLSRDFDLDAVGLPAELRRHDRHVGMSFVAAREALADARIEALAWGRRLGLVFSTCSGPMLLIEQHYSRLVRGQPQISRDELYAKRYYAGAQVLAQVLGIRGYTATVVTACTAGAGAIALAADLIRCGMLDAVLAGGADAFSLSTLAGFDGLKATSETKCAPFSKPYGLNLGEAACFVFLESGESAARREATIRAEVLGSGLSNDAFHCSAPEPTGRGLGLAMQRALADAGLSPEQVSYLNAHGTGTEANDKAETRAIRRVFGAHADRLSVSSTKSMVGHCLGAAGVLEVVASVLCAEAGVFPPTANFVGPRDGCNLDYVPDSGRPWPVPRPFLSNNLAFGGHNTSLVLATPSAADALVQSPAAGPAGDGLGDASGAAAAGHRAEVGEVLEDLGQPTPPAPVPVVLTACGVVSVLGLGVASLAEAGGQNAPWRFLPGLAQTPAGLVDEALVEQWDRRLDWRHMDRASRWATVATRLALREASLPPTAAVLSELGLFLHLSAGPSRAESEFLTSFLSHDHHVNQLAAFPYIVPSSVAGNVCRALRLTGHNLTLSCGPGAGLIGLGAAAAALRAGHTEALLTGAVDELSERILADQASAGLLVDENAFPGEGATVLLLETARHTRARGAKPLAQIVGLAFATDDVLAATTVESALRETILEALAQAAIDPEQVGAICVQGPSQRLRSTLASLRPAWPEQITSMVRRTGLLEASQVILDLAAVLATPPTGPGASPYILLAVASIHGLTGAAVLQRAQFVPCVSGPGSTL